MNHILLTGAGFSRNWGGWLADEAFEYLLGCSEITHLIRQQLWKSKGQGLGFEDALREMRVLHANHAQDDTKSELRVFERMLESMFHTMATGFAVAEFEPGQNPSRLGHQPSPIRDFLCRFDAIFTLNQDTLLEQRYAQSGLLDGSQGRWFGLESPGLTDVLVNGQKYQAPGVFKPADAPFKLKDRYQPYYKLHGSSHWRTSDDAALLILGGDKGNDISKVQLLSWYQMEFARMSQQSTRIMIIGYGFGDSHINDLLIMAARAGAEFFIVDTSGIGVLASAAGTQGIPSQLKMAMQHSIIGASRRHLKDSLHNDTVERTKIMRFFK